MIPCTRCGRHHNTSERRCPFCSSQRTVFGTAGLAVATVLTPMVLAACYGCPPDKCDDFYDTGRDTGQDSGEAENGSDDTGAGGGDADDTGDLTDTGAGVQASPELIPDLPELPECPVGEDVGAR